MLILKKNHFIIKNSKKIVLFMNSNCQSKDNVYLKKLVILIF